MPSYLSLLCYQAAQLTHVLNERLKKLFVDAKREKVLKDVATATAKEKVKTDKAVEKKANASEKARALAEKRLTEMEMKLEGTKLKLAEAESLNLSQANEIIDLKASLEACENKWYNEGFANAENSAEPVVCQA